MTSDETVLPESLYRHHFSEILQPLLKTECQMSANSIMVQHKISKAQPKSVEFIKYFILVLTFQQFFSDFCDMF